MFKNAGSKIKIIAYIVFVLGVISAVIGGIATIAVTKSVAAVVVDEAVLYTFIATLSGMLTIVLGIAVAYVAALLLYGYGIIVENSEY